MSKFFLNMILNTTEIKESMSMENMLTLSGFTLYEERATAPVTIFSSVRTINGEERSQIWPLSRLFAYQTEDEELKGITDKLRKIKEKDKALYKDKRKHILPVFVLGDWPVRGTLEIPVKLLVFDIDDGNEKSYLQHLASAHLCPFVYRLEQSLEGGCRVYVWADYPQEERKAAYQAIAEKLATVFSVPLKEDDQSGEHIDTTTKDISRMWFPAFTPPDLVYHNEESSVFEYTPKEKKKDNRREKKEKLNGYKYEFTEEEKVNDCIRQLEAAQMDITGSVTGDWFKILLAFANWKREAGREYAQRVSALGPSYSPQEFEYQYGLALTKDRGQVTIGSFLELCKDCGIRYDAKVIIAARKQSTPPEKIFPVNGDGGSQEPPITTIHQEEEPEEFFQFYEVIKGEPRIKHLKLVQLLLKLGFVRHDIDGEFFIVQINNNVVRECTKQEVIDAFDNYLDKQPAQLPDKIEKEDLRNKIYAGIAGFFSNDILGRLRPPKPIIFNEHTKDTAYFYYQNGFVEITKDYVRLRPYSELKNCIWENQILQRDFMPVSASKYRDFSFYRFLQNVANCWEVHPKYDRTNPHNDPLRMESFRTIIGYLLHSFFERELKAVIFTDSRISEDNDANGRSGKTLLLKALGHVLNREFKRSKTYVELNGKDFDTGKTFKYQELGLDTKLIHLNDIKRGFKFEDLFNDITEGIKRERKNEAPSIIRAKMALSTNLTVKIAGSSAKGRAVEVELAEYYDDNWTPKDEFGEWFFADWTATQWAMFDNILMECVRLYFRKGITTPQTINLQERKKVEETAPEFVQWMEDREVANQSGERFKKSDLHKYFVERYPDFEWLKQRTFTGWLRLYCEYDENYSGIEESRSNGESYVTFKTTAGGA